MKYLLSIYDHSVMMHVKFREDVMDAEKLFPIDCLNINEFWAIHMNIHENVLRYTGIIAL